MRCIWFPGWSFDSKIFDELKQQFNQLLTDQAQNIEHQNIEHIDYQWPDEICSFDQAVKNFIDEHSTLLTADTVLIGWSLGGAMAKAIHIETPETRLITLASDNKFCTSSNANTYELDTSGETHGAMLLETFIEFQHNFQQAPEKTLKRFLSLCAQGTEKTELKPLLSRLKSLQLTCETEQQRQLLINQLAWLNEFDFTESVIDSSRQPAQRELHINAQNDALFSRHNKEGLTLEKTCHSLPLQQTEEVAKKIAIFLNIKDSASNMSVRDKQQVARHFSRAAHSYDEAATMQHYSNDHLISLLSQQIEPDKLTHCLDLGCGTGTGFQSLAQLNFENISGLDLSETMIEVCEEKVSNSPDLTGKVDLHIADAEQQPFDDNTFDAVFSNLMIQWCEQPDKLWQELSRVLKSQGLIAFATLGPNTMHELKTAWSKVDPLVHVNKFTPLDELTSSLTPYFDIVAVEQTDYLQHFTSLTQLLRNLKAIGATNVNSGRGNGLGGRQKIRQLNNAYPRAFTDNIDQLPLTYDLIWIVAKNKQ